MKASADELAAIWQTPRHAPRMFSNAFRSGPTPIGWEALKMRNFRQEFNRALLQVLEVYRDAKTAPMGHSIRLFESRPPITQKLVLQA